VIYMGSYTSCYVIYIH